MKKKILIKELLVLLVIFRLSLIPVFSQNNLRTISVNIAKGCPYTWSVKPNYSLSTDDNDNNQLTDGLYTQGSFWSQKSTVGWQNYRSVTIVIDLGTDRPINGFSLSTAAGAAGVTFPKAIFVMTSMNGTDFYKAGDLVQMVDSPLPAPTSYSKFTYRTTNVKTHGRYVLFNLITSGDYIFTDEIEVYEGSIDFLNLSYSELPVILNFADMSAYHTTIGCLTRFTNDIKQIRTRLEASDMAANFKKSVSDNLDKLTAQANNFTMSDATGFRAVVPFNSIHSDILACFGQILEYEGFPNLTVWHSHRYAPLSLFETPDKVIPSLTIKMMQNEYRSEAFNLTNTGKTPLDVTFRLEGLPDCVEVRQAEYVDTREGIVVADALTPVSFLSGNYKITVPSGMTRQIWLTFNPKITGEANYSGNIKIDAGDIHNTLPLALHISSSCFPEQPTLNVGTWDYAGSNGYGINEKNQEKVIADLRSHLVNVAYGSKKHAAVPVASNIDKDGHITKSLDFSAFDEWLRIWPNAKHYQIYFGVTLSDNKFAGISRGTTAFKQAVKEWAAAWDAHIQSLNLSKGQVQINFIDEPRTPEYFSIIQDWAGAFKSGSKLVDVFSDPNKLDLNNNMDYAPAALSFCDVLCPKASDMLVYPANVQSFFDKRMKESANLWLYQCEPNKHVDPTYFRTQPWYAFQMGATGSCFWNYNDSRGNLWNDYTATYSKSFAFVYLDDNGPISTKHWEAFREGIEDYEYLKMLSPDLSEKIMKDMIEKLEAVTLKNLSLGWNAKNPSAFADEGRLAALKKIEETTSINIHEKKKTLNSIPTRGMD